MTQLLENSKKHQFNLLRRLRLHGVLKKINLTIILTLSIQLTFAQDIINNGDFENYTELPNYAGKWNYCIGWHNLNGSTVFTEPFGSPDYYHKFGLSDVHLPNAFSAYVFPYSGDAIMGFATAATTKPEFKEYISTEFISPMIPGVEYEVSFYMTNGESDWISSSSGCDHIGLLLSVERPIQVFNEAVLRTPQMEIEGTVWNTEWVKHSFTYIADSAYKHITIGAFVKFADLSFVYGPNEPKNKAYNFIDKMEVKYTVKIARDADTTLCLGDSLRLHAYNDGEYRWVADSNSGEIISYEQDVVVSPTVPTTYYVYGIGTVDSIKVIPSLAYCEPILEMPNVFSPNGDGLNDYFEPIYTYAIEYSTVNIINRWGNVIYTGELTNKGWNGKTKFDLNTPGTYFWQVSYIGHNGNAYTMHGNVMLVR